jgi:excisionase family DNA binding protein
MNGKWLNTEEAAKYLGIGKTKLYALSQAGKLPVSKVGKNWLYEKESLDTWLRASAARFESFFVDVEANIESNTDLREPQREAYAQAYDFFKKGKKKAIIQLPVGCGKSGLASILPFGISQGRVLIVAPNLTIKEELRTTLDITNKQKCFWRRMRVLNDKDMMHGPYVCTLELGNISVCEKSHIVLTNIQQLAMNPDKWLNKFPEGFFDMIIIDEAHHAPASSWKAVLERFPNAKIVYLTATPFRSDRQELDGELIYRYPFKSASIKGFIKKLRASYVAPSELTFTVEGEQQTFTLEQILAMKEEEWFSRGVALSDPCNISIVDNSLEKLEKLRQSGTKHQLIAVACSINHAQRIRSMFEERGYHAEVIHSKLEADKQEEIIRDLKNGTLDCIVQVQMLGEGFDHPKLSVAAIFRPFRSLAPYIQFVGRILRVIVQNDPTHPDNYGHIVTHVGLNLDEQLKRFKQFENDDQAFWEEVTGGKEPDPPHEVIEGKARMKLHEDMVVDREIVDRVFEEEFTTAQDEDVVADLEKKLESLGLDSSLARQIVKSSNQGKTTMSDGKAAAPFSVLPQKQWEEAKKRLNEEVKRTANILLNRVELTQEGREIPFKLKPGIGARNNYIGALQLVNEELAKKFTNKKRNEFTTEEFVAAVDALPEILNALVREIKKIQNVRE